MSKDRKGASRTASVTIVTLSVISVVAIGLGVLAARLAAPEAPFIVALIVTVTAAFFGGAAAAVVLRRPSRRRGRTDTTQ